jgi:hypothetical protein
MIDFNKISKPSGKGTPMISKNGKITIIQYKAFEQKSAFSGTSTFQKSVLT